VRAYLAYVKFVFRALEIIVTAVTKALRAAFGAAWDWITAKAADAKGRVIGYWQAIRDAIRAIFSTIRDIVGAAWAWIGDKASDARDRVLGIFESLRDRLVSVFNAVRDLISDALRTAADAINKLISAANKLPGVNIPSVSVSLASTAPVTAPYAAPRVRSGVGAQATATGAPVVINVTGALDPEAVARQINRILAGHNRRVGLAVS
jgi:hypothetical protein